jgi:hypothetical protein
MMVAAPAIAGRPEAAPDVALAAVLDRECEDRIDGEAGGESPAPKELRLHPHDQLTITSRRPLQRAHTTVGLDQSLELLDGVAGVAPDFQEEARGGIGGEGDDEREALSALDRHAP